MATAKTRPGYETPSVVTYSDSDIRKQMGYIRGGGSTPEPGGFAPMNSLYFYPEPEDPNKSSKKYRSAFDSRLY